MQINRDKNKWSQFFLSALSAVIFTLVVGTAVYAATSDSVDLTINVQSLAPTIGSPSDNGSASSTPTNVGSDVTFSTTATDPNGDGYWLAICKTGGSITPGTSGAAPTCTAGDWCISSSAAASGVQNSCTYTVQQSDSESNNWEAYVCDDDSTTSSCSAADTGDSSFNVNHPPVIGTVAIGPSYGSSASVDPGNGTTGVVYFQVGVTDPDSNGGQDTIDMYACSGATTGFVASTATCTGGTLLCSDTGVTTGTNAQCSDSDLAPIPTTHGTKNVKIYLRDNSSTKLADDGTNNSQSYSITDVAPTVSNFSIGSNPLVPIAGNSVNQTYTATISDNNGFADITSASGAIYTSPATLTGAGICTTDSEFNCYDTPSCSLTGGSGTSVTANCGAAGNLITTWFNIKPSSEWKAHVNAVSDLGTTSLATEGTFTVNSLNALAVAEANINYNNLSPGATSTSQTITIQNAGNVITDALISGDNMEVTSYSGSDCVNDADCISRAQQHWAASSSFTWGSGDFTLLETPSVGTASNGCSDRTIAVTSDHTTLTTSQIYWKLKIPATQAAGSYTGTNAFVATPNNCSGGE